MVKTIKSILIISLICLLCPFSALAKDKQDEILISTVDLNVEYEVLGEVSIKKKSFIFAVPVKLMNKLLREKAKRIYPDADAVIKVKHDRIIAAQGILDKEVGKTAKGIAVKILEQKYSRQSFVSFQQDPEYEEVMIYEESAPNGIFDPSLEYEPEGKIGWMAYSVVEEPGRVHTHMAKSSDNGKTWKKVIEVNVSAPAIINTPDNRQIKGVWRHEVPTLVHDPNDQGRQWKLFWHKYFVKSPFRGQDRMFHYGWIAYKYAADPQGPWSDDIALLGAGGFPPKPFQCEINLNSLHKSLKGMVAYSEPGSLYKDDVLYLVLQCHESAVSKLILFASDDHAKSWKYVNTLLTAKDAQAFGYQHFTAPSLVQENNRVFLLMSPMSPIPVDHDGTAVIEFEDITKGLLKRNTQGQVLIHKYLPVTFKEANVNAGESDYDEYNTYGGIVMPQIDLNKAMRNKKLELLDFKIFNTKEGIVESRSESSKDSDALQP